MEQYTSIDQLPDWAWEMVMGSELPDPSEEKKYNDLMKCILRECNLMGKYFGVPIAEDPKMPLPAQEVIRILAEQRISFGATLELPSRVVDHIAKNSGTYMNNFAFNTSPAMRAGCYDYAKPESKLAIWSRITNHPNITAQTKGDFYKAFETSIQRFRLLERYHATLQETGWHTPGKTNGILVPVFLDLASQGWNLHQLAG